MLASLLLYIAANEERNPTMLTNWRQLGPLLLCLGLALTACSDDDALPPDGAVESDGMVSQDGSPESDGATGPTDKGLLVCDAIYIPVVRVLFEDAAGSCVVGKASYTVVGSDAPSVSVDCPCPPDTSFGGLGCILDPPLGEQVEITGSAEGYVSQKKTVDVPYVCVPNLQLKFEMVVAS